MKRSENDDIYTFSLEEWVLMLGFYEGLHIINAQICTYVHGKYEIHVTWVENARVHGSSCLIKKWCSKLETTLDFWC